MKNINLFILLLLISSTALFGQQQALDSTKTYGIHQLRLIADSLTKGQEYRRLLVIANQEISNRGFALSECQKETRSALSESQLKEGIIKDVKKEAADTKLQLQKTNRKLIATKIGWGSTTLGLLVALGYVFLHK